MGFYSLLQALLLPVLPTRHLSLHELPSRRGGGKKIKTSQKRSSSSASDVKSVVPSGKLPIVYHIDSKHSLQKAFVTAHERYGHVSPKN